MRHRNFNPGLVACITNPTRHEFKNSSGYWPYIQRDQYFGDAYDDEERSRSGGYSGGGVDEVNDLFDRS
jgi:hypothetical protein